MANELTICSVAYANGHLLGLNIELTIALNRSADWRWLVVDNAPDRPWRPAIHDRRVEFVLGDRADPSHHPRLRGSYHHAAALNKAKSMIGSRFVLFVDPDFYLVRPEWMGAVVQHMIDRDLTFFGAPWHPRWFTKYRYFPCVHCLFVDLARVREDALDFTPDLTTEMVRDLERDQQTRSVISSLLLVLTLRDRRSIGASHDTGYRVYSQFHSNEATRSDTARPVYRPRVDLSVPRHATSWPSRLLERWLPDDRCFVPKVAASYATSTFHDLGYPDAAGRGWEEYLWRGEPFGFHLRTQRQAHSAPYSAEVSAFLAVWKQLATSQ